MQVSVVIPVYNEEANLAELVERVGAAMQRSGRSFELIVVDDGSCDGSARVLESLGAARGWLKPLYLSRNYGQSAALQAGFDKADLSRVIQGVVAGIGFLGAGAIIKLNEKEQIKGLTTAASIWATAAIGVASGLGHVVTAGASTLLALVILAALPRVEKYIERRNAAPPPAA